MKKLVFVDIDETLFYTKAKILVKDKETGKIIKELTNKDFNTYKLDDNEEFDFVQFSSADIFTKTSEPNMKMIDLVRKKKKNNIVCLLTARGDFDNKEKVLNFLRKYGLNVGHYKEGKIHIIRTGNKKYLPVAVKKRRAVEKVMFAQGLYDIELYDDSIENIKEFLKLNCLYPDRTFTGYLVKDENIIPFRTIKEVENYQG